MVKSSLRDALKLRYLINDTNLKHSKMCQKLSAWIDHKQKKYMYGEITHDNFKKLNWVKFDIQIMFRSIWVCFVINTLMLL